MIQYRKKVLENGLTLVTVEKPGHLFSMNLGIRTGSLHEGPEERGLSHFIEHMLFKGTEVRSNEALNDAIEALGGDVNAFTDHISTVYTVTALAEELESALALLHEMVRFPAFSPEETEKEKNVVLSELRSSLDDPEDRTLRNLYYRAYAQSALKYDVIGTYRSIQSFTSQGLHTFHQTHYVPENAVVVLVSPHPAREMESLLEARFASWPRGTGGKAALEFEQNRPGLHEKVRDMEQASLGMLFSMPVREEEKLPLRILNYKLGQSANSVLFRELREKRGFAYDVYSDLDLTRHVENLLIFTQVSEDHLQEAHQLILVLLEEIKAGKHLTAEDILRMKKILKTGIYAVLENAQDLCASILDDLLSGEEPLAFMEDLKRLDHVTEASIRSAARRMLREPTVVLMHARSEGES